VSIQSLIRVANGDYKYSVIKKVY